MSQYVGKIVCLLGIGFVFIAATGCAPRAYTTVADLDPYVGSRPDAAQPLPKKVVRRTPRRTAPAAGSKWIPAKGISDRWKYIVIHHSASEKSTPQGMRDWHIRGRGWDELGYHFVIGNGVGYADGKVFVGKRWDQQKHGAHCKTPGNQYNDNGIGICLIGDFQTGKPTQRQMEALAQLVAFLQSKCSIPTARVVTHKGVTGKTACPGRNFSMHALHHTMSQRTISASSH